MNERDERIVTDLKPLENTMEKKVLENAINLVVKLSETGLEREIMVEYILSLFRGGESEGVKEFAEGCADLALGRRERCFVSGE